MDGIERAFRKVIELGKEKIRPQDYIGVTLANSDNSRKPIFLTWRRLAMFDVDIMFAELVQLIQSDENFDGRGPHHLTLSTVKAVDGKGRIRNKVATDDDIVKDKKSIVQIKNIDNLCLPRALVIGIALLKKDESPAMKREYFNVRDGRTPQQRDRALKLCEDSGVDITALGGGIEALKIFQQFLKEYKIIVYSDTSGKNVVFEDERNTSEQYIDLFYHDEHYDLINSMTGFVGLPYYCRSCRVAFSVKSSHRCPNVCKKCLKSPPCPTNNIRSIQCPSCYRFFESAQCLKNHLEPHFPNNKSVCAVIKYCTDCRRQYSLEKIENHKCGYSRCGICHIYLPFDHKCHVQPLKVKDTGKNSKLFIFYDFECRQDEVLAGGVRPHIVNFAVLQLQCLECLGNANIQEDCSLCGKREFIIPSIDESNLDDPDEEVIEGDRLLEEFFKIVRKFSLKFSQIILIAHNSRGYDGQFLLKFMIEKLRWDPKVILCGGLIQSMQYERLIFRDSLNFFSCPLSALPKMMGIQGVEKGFFPHFFNRKDTQNYVGELPSEIEYGIEDMRTPQREEFLKWYVEEKASGKIFNFAEEMLRYCRSDVSILRQASLKFRELLIQVGKTDPLENVTIAGACMTVFRRMFLKKNQIGIIPHKGYRGRDKQSAEALRWMKYQELAKSIKIQTSLDGPEVKIGGYKVDGYCDDYQGKKTVFEYHVSNEPRKRKIFFKF